MCHDAAFFVSEYQPEHWAAGADGWGLPQPPSVAPSPIHQPAAIGLLGPVEQNENVVCLLDFCAVNRLVITNTLFQHWPCHQLTWFHPAESSRTGRGYVLDYVLVNQHFPSSVLDTRVYRKTISRVTIASLYHM